MSATLVTMVKWRQTAQITAPEPPVQQPKSGPMASTKLFYRHFAPKGRAPVPESPWADGDINDSPPPSPPQIMRSQVLTDGPMFTSFRQPLSDYPLSKLETIKPPRSENGSEINSNYSTLTLSEVSSMMNGHKKDIPNGITPIRGMYKKRKAPAPPEPPIDYEPPPRPPSPAPSNASSKKTVRISDAEPEVISNQTPGEKFYEEFKNELITAAINRSQKGHVEPPVSRGYEQAYLFDRLKKDIVKAAEERAKRGPIEEPPKSPTMPNELAEELKAAYAERMKRRAKGSLRMKKQDERSSVIYQPSQITYVPPSVEDESLVEWTPEQDLDDDLDGPDLNAEYTARAKTPTFFHIFTEPGNDKEYKRYQKNSKKDRGKKLKKHMKNAWGSISRSFVRKTKLKDIVNDDNWEIYHTEGENYDEPPEGPIPIHHIEKRPAYAYNPVKGQLMLIPNFDRVIVTPDGKQIREDMLTSVQKYTGNRISTVSQDSHVEVIPYYKIY